MLKKRFIAFITLAMLFCLLCGCTAVHAEGGVEMLVLTVGKADAIILKLEDKNYLIDAATSKMDKQLMTGLEAMGITKLDAVFLTHTDKDHGGGMKKLGKSDIEIDAWYASAFYIDKTPEKHQAYLAAKERGQEVTFLKAGDSIAISETSYFEVIAPIHFYDDSENNNSLVMIVHTPHGRILLAADMQIPEEMDVLAAKSVVPCEVLKVGHHGDNRASSYNFLATVKPQIAVISTSTEEENDTPSGDVLQGLRQVGAKTYVTQATEGGVLVTLKDGIAIAEYVNFQ